MSDFKIDESLKNQLLDIIYNAEWYWTCTGHQNEYNSELELDEHEIESTDRDRVVGLIVDAVLNYIGEKDATNRQLKRIADNLELLSQCTHTLDGGLKVFDVRS